jgi:anti-sigma factor RsiW
MDQEQHATMATVDDLTCRELVALVTNYLEGALTLGERSRFERHLGTCSVCPRYVEQLRATVRVLGKLGEDDVPSPARSALLEAFRAWKKSA